MKLRLGATATHQAQGYEKGSKDEIRIEFEKIWWVVQLHCVSFPAHA